jgi:hypothetical protein
MSAGGRAWPGDWHKLTEVRTERFESRATGPQARCFAAAWQTKKSKNGRSTENMGKSGNLNIGIIVWK